MNKTFTTLIAFIFGITAAHSEKYVGGDISLLPEYESHGAIYKTHDGKQISSLLPWLHEQGMNSMRVRLFVDPSKYKGSDKDPNACQNLEYITPLCKRIVENGFDLMLDFHYSDTWADPAKQYTPADWAGLNDEELYEKIYSYTKECLTYLKNEGVVPTFIQPGNEISYGMLWGPEGTPSSSQKKALMGSNANWDRFGKLLKQAIKACREVCPDAKIIIHNERVAQVNVLTNFYDKMKALGVDYDIIGLSYYPYFHGDINILEKALNALQEKYTDKNIMIVETGYSYKWEVPGTTHDLSSKYPYSDAGQNKFITDLITMLDKHPSVNGLYWWWFEYNAFNTSLSGWYNAPLFDSTNGRATSALKTLCKFAENSGVNEIIRDESQKKIWYDLNGNIINEPHGKGIYILQTSKGTFKIAK